jgi:hypothetical protein
LPEQAPVSLPVAGTLGPGAQKECSGIVKSRTHDHLFWVHNDSGDEPRIYAVRRNGELVRPNRRPGEEGVLVGGAINVDWEDIAVDDRGNVIVADFGNNRESRRDLVLYFIPEPATTADRTTFIRRVFFHYPEQTQFPAPEDDLTYDAEALFYADGKCYVLTRHHSDTLTKLYRLDATEPFVSNAATLVDTFDIGAKVTGADASPDGTKFAPSLSCSRTKRSGCSKPNPRTSCSMVRFVGCRIRGNRSKRSASTARGTSFSSAKRRRPYTRCPRTR